MARKPRVHFPGALYHVIARGNKGVKVFNDDKDYSLYLDLLKEYKNHFGFLLYAYVLMPTHVHLLIGVGEVAVSKVMQRLQFRYTRNYNLRHKSWGHLFQGRYKAILCEKDSYLLELSAYIHLNPVRSGMVKDPGHYQWSSYRCYLRGRGGEWVDSDFILSQYSKQKANARREYGRFTKSRAIQGHREDFYELRDQRFLGGEEFVEKVHENLKEVAFYIYDLSIREIVSKVSLVLEVHEDLIYSISRNRPGAWGRAVVGYWGRKLAGYSIKEVAEHFQRDPVAISQGIKKVEEKTREDKVFTRKMAALEEFLTRGKNRKILS